MPPAEGSQQLSRADLVNFFASTCTPRANWRFGVEHEKVAYCVADTSRPDYGQLQALLRDFCQASGWAPVTEDGNLIGAVAEDGANVSLEPGGQVELSGAPVTAVAEVQRETAGHLAQLKEVAARHGIAFSTLAYDPQWPVAAVDLMPKERYRILRPHIARAGTLGLDIMHGSASTQVNINYESEADMVAKYRVSLALQPVATAIFANSPFKEGRPNGYLSWRSHGYQHLDDARTGMLPEVFEDDFGWERYVDYLLSVPMADFMRRGRHISAIGRSFPAFIAGKMDAAPGEHATLQDFQAHLQCVLPEVRLKRCVLEMRGADVGPPEHIAALTAFWVGVMYDDEALAGALALVADWTTEERQKLRDEAPRTGLQTPFRQGTVQDVARAALRLARAGLARRGKGEERFLEHAEQIVQSGETLAQVLLRRYHEEWNQDIRRVYCPEYTF